MTQDPRTARERAVELLRATLATTTWLPDTEAKRLVWAIRGVLVLGLLILLASVVERGLWDWLDLLIIPAVLAAGGLWFNRQQRARELEIAREQREQDAMIAESRTQDEALQAYLDHMTDMLRPGEGQPSLYKARPGDSVSSVARARTLTVLARLDGERKARIVQFLHESGLIAKGCLVLDLHGADLREAVLSGADLSGADLSGALLGRAVLRGADLSGTDLRRANMLQTVLSEADLSEADLSEAILWDADLHRAHLTKANLSRANMSSADLKDLDQQAAYLTGATMPNGQKYEDWLKDGEGGKEDADSD